MEPTPKSLWLTEKNKMREGCRSGQLQASEISKTGILLDAWNPSTGYFLMRNFSTELNAKWHLFLENFLPVFILSDLSSFIKQTLPLKPFALSWSWNSSGSRRILTPLKCCISLEHFIQMSDDSLQFLFLQNPSTCPETAEWLLCGLN